MPHRKTDVLREAEHVVKQVVDFFLDRLQLQDVVRPHPARIAVLSVRHPVRVWHTLFVSPNYVAQELAEPRTVPPDRRVRRTLVLACGNHYPEWMPFLTLDRSQDLNLCA
ncbi:hypothetical protein E2C01_037614 [Portunus trituberculatus]|uniref:Uncharacterized protein n=1 Tax=Portunus trituberculatus TaxID=210409 RepID=A0A5B7FHI3_PORTR|nr:hypothetical protein [Portunus trituberculatus]